MQHSDSSVFPAVKPSLILKAKCALFCESMFCSLSVLLAITALDCNNSCFCHIYPFSALFILYKLLRDQTSQF